ASRPKMKARWDIDLSPGGRNRPLSAGARIARKGEGRAGCGSGADTRELAWLALAPLARRRVRIIGTGACRRPRNRIDKGQGTRITGSLRKPPFKDRELIAVAKPELGAKRQCQACGAKFFDLNKDPIVCPKCGTIFQGALARARPASKEEEEDSELSVPAGVDMVSLDDVTAGEEKAVETVVGDIDVEDDAGEVE